MARARAERERRQPDGERAERAAHDMGHERAEPSGSSRASWLVWLERPLVAREPHH